MRISKLLRVMCLYSVCASAADFTWSVSKLADPWVASGWLPGQGLRCVALTVNPISADAHKVQLLYSTLVEQSTKMSLPATALWLCPGTKKCTQSESVDASQGPQPFTMCLAGSFWTHGSFQGAVAIGAAEKPDGEQILKSIQVSSAAVKLFGFVLILIGVGVAWGSKVWARSRLDRDSALQPVLLLRSNFDSLKTRIKNLRDGLSAQATNTPLAIDRLNGGISDAELDGNHLLPPFFPNPFGSPTDLAGLKTLLDQTGASQQTITVLVGGMESAAAMDVSRVPGGPNAVADAIRKIDLIAQPVLLPAAAQAQSSVQEILKTLQPPAPTAAFGSLAKVPEGPASDRLQIDIERVSAFVWFVWGVLTAATGLAALILTNPGFGTPMDLLYCFFWGFGLPAVGQQLTPGSAGTSLGISIPKTS